MAGPSPGALPLAVYSCPAVDRGHATGTWGSNPVRRRQGLVCPVCGSAVQGAGVHVAYRCASAAGSVWECRWGMAVCTGSKHTCGVQCAPVCDRHCSTAVLVRTRKGCPTCLLPNLPCTVSRVTFLKACF